VSVRKLTITDLPEDALRGKRVLVRVDYNVPLDEAGQITDDTRITSTLPTLDALLQQGAKVILMAHFGRPKGKPEPSMSLEPVAKRLEELLEGRTVRFVRDTAGFEARTAVGMLYEGDVLLLENTRFLPGEEKNDPALAEEMAALGDVFVNDAFGAAHRAHSSTAGVAKYMRAQGKPAVAGLLMDRELEYLGRALAEPKRPFVAILGGAKISGKIDVIRSLLPKVDRLIIGGAMANTFFKAMDLATGTSLVEDDRLEMARELLATSGDKLVLPTDAVVAATMDAGQATQTVGRESIPADRMVLDIGPATVAEYRRILADAGTVLWNGPMGVFEVPEFAAGTKGVAEAVAEATDRGATTIIGGGDSAAAVGELGLEHRMSHVSTGGGASLEFLEGKELPGVAALMDAGAA